MPLVDELLEGQLVEAVRHVHLDADDVVAVVERLRGVAIGEAAHQLVEDRESEPDQ